MANLNQLRSQFANAQAARREWWYKAKKAEQKGDKRGQRLASLKSIAAHNRMIDLDKEIRKLEGR